MKINERLIRKYGTSEVIIPPPPADGEEVIIPVDEPTPEIKQLSPEEMKQWEEFIRGKKLLQDLEITKEITDLGEEEKLSEERGTRPAIPHKKKASSSVDEVARLCHAYYKLAGF